MSLIDQTDNYVEPTKEQKLKQAKARIKRISSGIYQGIRQQHEEVWGLIWNNKRDLTPQEVLDEMGEDAASLFLFSTNIQSMLYQADPTGYIPVETPNEFTVNGDGTVTIGDPRV